MKIVITIEADSAEEAKQAMTQLGGAAQGATVVNMSPEPQPPAPEKPKATRARAEKPAASEMYSQSNPPANTNPLDAAPAPTGNPLETAAPTAGDPLAGQPTTVSSDPLGGTSAPATVNPLGAAPAQAATAPTGEITLAMIREKIGQMTEKKQAAKDAIATFLKADGTPCEKPSDIQESDYAAVYEKLDWL